jgi:hypothetical protein
MLNKNKERELAYIVQVDSVEPIEGYDRIAYATVGGWHCVVDATMKAGDKAVYFEIDSLLPSDDERFAFCSKYKYKIKTQKYVKGTKISQGLLMPITEFPEFADKEVGDFVTKDLKVTYYDPMDRARKSNRTQVEYTPLFKKIKNYFPFKQLMRTKIGREILLSIFGMKKKKTPWPSFMPHSDQERIQNASWILNNKTPFICSEKIDGCSSGYAIEKTAFGYKYYVCSRNVVLTRNSKTYYDDMNVWFENYDKYNIKDFLTAFIKETGANWVYLQGESYGDGIQKRDYSLKGHDFAAFELCTSNRVRYTYTEMKEILDRYSIPTVPIISDNYILPDSVDELLKYAQGISAIDGKEREGIVFQNIDDPTISFKAVDNEFLIKYH